MPIQGFVKKRKHQFGRQTAQGTAVPATRAYPFQGVPDVDLAWTDPEVDTGSIYPVVAPHRETPVITASLTDNSLAYNNVPILMSGIFGGDVDPTGGGTAKTWTHEPDAVTVDPFDRYTYQFGDDVLTDWFQLIDGILTSVEITIPEGPGVCTVAMDWKYGAANSTGSTDSPVTGTVPTPDLTVDINPAYVYKKDLSIFIADDPDYVNSSQILDALHSGVIRITQEIDEKFFANGTQAFEADDWGRASAAIEYELTFAKTADTVGVGSESDDWMSDQSVDRYIRLWFESTVLAQTPSTPYSWDISGPMRYYTRADGEIGGNTTVTLTGHAFLDAEGFGGVIRSILIGTLAAAEL